MDKVESDEAGLTLLLRGLVGEPADAFHIGLGLGRLTGLLGEMGRDLGLEREEEDGTLVLEVELEVGFDDVPAIKSFIDICFIPLGFREGPCFVSVADFPFPLPAAADNAEAGKPGALNVNAKPFFSPASAMKNMIN